MRIAVTVWTLLLSVAGTAMATIPVEQRSTLQDVYDSTRGSGWLVAEGWLGPAGTECQWYGVLCDGGETTVVELALGGNRLLGEIPTTISALVDLERLDLASNTLGGAIPPELAQLSHLLELDLAGNELEGGIPPGLGSITGLEVLDLSDNHLEGPLPAELGQLATLRRIGLRANAFMEEIPAAWIGLTGLEPQQSDLRWNGLFTDHPALRTLLDAAHVPEYNAWHIEQIVRPWGLSAAETTGISTALSWQTPWLSGYYSEVYNRVVWEVAVAPTPTGPFELLETASTVGLGVDEWRVFGLEPATISYLAVRIRYGPDETTRNTLVTGFSDPVEVVTPADPSTLHVDPGGLPTNDCLTPASPCPTIQMATDLASDGRRIVVAPGLYVENLVIRSAIELVGAGMDLTTIDGDQAGPTVLCDPTSSATTNKIRLRDLTITGGNGEGGGGVSVARFSIVGIKACRIEGNTGGSGGGIGGGWGLIEVVDSIIENNTATDFGGGLAMVLGIIDVHGGTISGNTAPQAGGLYIQALASLDSVVVRDNIATGSIGGGLLVDHNWMTIRDSSIVGNSALTGGGVFLEHENVSSMINTTVSGNIGGGIHVGNEASLSMDACTVVDNRLPWGYGISSFGDTRVRSTVVALNEPADCDFEIESLGGNLDGGLNCGLDAWGDLTAADPLLGPLEQTVSGQLFHQPLDGSPLRDGGNPVVFPTTDQLGNQRPFDGDGDGVPEPDIGAVEVQSSPFLFADGFETGNLDRWTFATP
jgi:hypothetical protein